MSGSRLLDSGGRVKVRTSMLSQGATALSVLSIDRVEQADRGNYTCKPASGGEASISLHVLEGTSLKWEFWFAAAWIFYFICLEGTIASFDILLPFRRKTRRTSLWPDRGQQSIHITFRKGSNDNIFVSKAISELHFIKHCCSISCPTLNECPFVTLCFAGLTAVLVVSAHNYFLKEIYKGF